jgi:hypothetical protein
VQVTLVASDDRHRRQEVRGLEARGEDENIRLVQLPVGRHHPLSLDVVDGLGDQRDVVALQRGGPVAVVPAHALGADRVGRDGFGEQVGAVGVGSFEGTGQDAAELVVGGPDRPLGRRLRGVLT